jgi:Domain of unknown function (DUF4157)
VTVLAPPVRETSSDARARPEPVAGPPAPQREVPVPSGGQPLPPTTRDRLETAFGVEVEDGRVHADAEDAELAEEQEAETPTTMRERIMLSALAPAEQTSAAPAAEPPREVAADPTARPVRLERVPEPEPSEPEAEEPEVLLAAFARGPPRAARREAQVVLAAAPVIQTKLTVSTPGDALEREAELVAAQILRSAPAAEANTDRRELPRIRGPPPPARDRDTLPRTVAAVVAAPGGGTPLDLAVRDRIEPHLGVDLSDVRVRRDPHAAAAARDLRARAFTSGATIFVGGESSPLDLGLIAHEATHVAQQRAVPAARTTLMRDVTDYLPDISVSDVIPDSIFDGVRSAVRAIPGYTLLTYVVGVDPLTNAPVQVSRQELIETLLTYGPFGPAVGPILQTIDVLGQVFDFVMTNLAAHNLTLARITGDVGRAWHEMSVTNGIAGNVAIVRQYVDGFLTDVRSFVSSIVDQVIEMVRAVVADVAEPLLETPEIAPVWNLTKKVLHYDPLHGTEVHAPTVEIISDFLRLIGQEERVAQMQERGTLQQTADWLDTQLATFASLVTELGSLFSDAWAAIQPQNLPDLMTNLRSLAQRAFGFVQRVGDFAATLILKILELVKNALLGWLSEHAHTIRGFYLLTVILGENPVTGEPVPRTAENLIKGFITLLPNGEATYTQLEQSGVIADAAARIEGAMSRLGISLEMITGLFHGIWDSLSLDDLLHPLDAFARVLAQFGEPLARLLEFIGEVLQVILELVLRLMNFPFDLLGRIIDNAKRAIEDIKRDPIAFFKNMLEAVKLGFSRFFDNILTYLAQGLAAWLFRGLRDLGITIPSDFTLQSILTLVLQILGITADLLWRKLGEHIGEERVAMIRGALDRLTGVWEFIKDVQENGISAVWRFVTDQLSNLWDTLLGMAKDWIMRTIVERVTVKLLSMLDPTGIMAVVNSFIAFFRAVQSAINYLREILEIVDRYVSTLAAVAAGNILPGAQMLEQGLAAAIPIAIGFLANQVGLGDIPEQIVAIIQQLRALVEQAIDWLIDTAIRLGQAALNALGLGQQQQPAGAPGGPKKQAEEMLKTRLATAKSVTEVQSVVDGVRTELQPAGLSALELRGPSADGKYEIFAAASDFERLCEMIPALGGPRAVVMEVTLGMFADVSFEGRPGTLRTREAERDPATGRIRTDESGAPVMRTTAFEFIPPGRGLVPGVLAAPPGQGQVQLLTYNTSEDPRRDDNHTHAEYQFTGFLRNNQDIANNVRTIRADINLSPCTLCSSTLSTAASLTPRATARSLHWHDVYRHPTRGTTDASLGAMSGWDVTPSGVSAESQAVLDAENWAAVT